MSIGRRSATDLLIGISLVNALLLDVWLLLFDCGTPTAFYRSVNRSDYAAAILCTLGGGLLLGGAVIVIRQSRQPWLIEVARDCFLATTLILANSLKKLRNSPPPDVGYFVDRARQHLGPAFVIAILSIIGVAVIVLGWKNRRVLAAAYALLLLCFSPFVAVTFARSAWLMATLPFDRFQSLPNARPTSVAPSANRVVVIIFDELDYGIVFGSRPRDLALPELDRLRAASISFDNIQSAATNTNQSIPSYLFGYAVQKLEPLGARKFNLLLQDGRRVRGDSLTSFIERAASSGYRAGVVGFFLPYCRLPLARATVRCAWEPFVSDGVLTASPSTVSGAALRQLKSLYPLNNRLSHIRRVQESVSLAKSAATDNRLDLVYLHLPTPHQPAIYDRHTHRFSTWDAPGGGYIDNVALTDRVLGEIRRAMEASGTWDSSTVIVTSDHGWRRNPARTSNDTRHIPFLVKPKGRSTAVRESTPLNSLLLGNLVLDLLNGAPASAPEVIRVLSATPSSP